ncbi:MULTISPECIES: hypothetical protein [Lysinibacillus]|uniref:hypothetical protein n=1 Tax=Lysinibacillus TaxID=400634 RepID=UPI00084B6D5C|nr:hypothetical protein [Lysinibacillus sphaericus]OEB99789.1 hypothetical protein GY31_22045 [Lysinibacillus sphaericus]
MPKKTKDLRLWDKNSNGIIPFLTRSEKLAIDLMKAIRLKDNIITAFSEEKILKTNSLNPLSIYQEELSEVDEGIISDLDKNGLLVYHVLLSYYMVGKQIEIQCEHEVSSFEKVIVTKSYLCVPKDIFADAMADDEEITEESDRRLVIKEYMEHEIFMANQGYLFAYVVNEEDGSADFYHIGVNVLNSNLIRES